MGLDMNHPLLNRRGLPAAPQFKDERILAGPFGHEAELLVTWRADLTRDLGEVSRVDKRDARGKLRA